MNILGAIANGMGAAGKTIGTGALAAGKGIADYLNAQAMRQSGLTPEQLQQNPQLARSAMGNWLGSIGQGMQTGDYTGSRLGYQQDMLTKLQNLQSMRQQDQMRQRYEQFKVVMAQADAPEKQAAAARMFPEFADQVNQAMTPLKTIAGINQDNASADFAKAQKDMLDWKRNNPDVTLHSFGNKVYAVDSTGNYKETGIVIPPHIQVAGDRLFKIDGGNVTEVGGGPRGITAEEAKAENESLKAAWIAGGGKPEKFVAFQLNEGDPLRRIDNVRSSMSLALSGMNRGASSVQAQATRNDAQAIADSIMNGNQPPTLTGLRNMAGPVRAELAKKGFDLTTADSDWRAIQRHVSTLNGPQQIRLVQAVNFAQQSLDNIESLYNEWQRVAPVSGYKDFNKGVLAVAAKSNTAAAPVAAQLIAQINDFTSEMGTVYKGGNASTDESLRLASENLKAEWNEATFKRSVQELKKTLGYRVNSINTSPVGGLSQNSLYAPQWQNQQPPAARPPLGSFGRGGN